MITRIDSISNFGVFQSFTWDKKTLPDFKDKNIIYGWNYSGKTTLSRVFSSIKNKALHPKFKESQFSIEVDGKKFNQEQLHLIELNVEVFNAEYIKDNLKWDVDYELDSISFDVGSNVELREEIERNLKQIDKISGTDEIIGRVNRFKTPINDFKEFELNKFSTKAGNIKYDVLNSLIEFNKGHLRKVRDTVIIDLSSHIITSSEERVNLKKIATANNDKSPLLLVKHVLNYQSIHVEVKRILTTTPLKTDNIELLDKDNDLYSWVRRGHELHNHKLSTCAFCSNPVSEERLRFLGNYFSNEAAKLKTDIDLVKRRILDEMVSVNKFDIPYSKNDYVEKCQVTFEAIGVDIELLKDKYLATLDDLTQSLETKEKDNIFNIIEPPSYDTSINKEFSESDEKIQQLIDDHNSFIKNFVKEQNTAREKLINHHVADFLLSENYLEKEANAKYSENCIKHYEYLVKKIKRRNEVLHAGLKSVLAGKEELNTFIKIFLNRSDIAIEVTEEDKFVLKRGTHYADNLSEGEKTAISFAYFLVTLESLHRDKKLTETIVYIDDPISSLDANHIAHVYSLINSFFFRAGLDPLNPEAYINCFKQLFISTHNFEFFGFLKDSKRLNKKEKPTNYYLIKRTRNNVSEIAPLPHTLKRKSEYVYLFEILYHFHKEGCDLNDEKYVLIPNALRRFFEIYTLTKIPDSTGEIDSRLKILMGDTHNLKLLHHFSHLTDFEKVAKHDEMLLILPDAMDEFMTLLKNDTIHFESLKRAIGEN